MTFLLFTLATLVLLSLGCLLERCPVLVAMAERDVERLENR